MAGTGLLLQTVQFGTLYLAFGMGVPPGLSSLVLSSCPVLVAAAAVPLFKERLSGLQWADLVRGLAGVAVSLSGNLSVTSQLGATR